jgi:hypothetical protein
VDAELAAATELNEGILLSGPRRPFSGIRIRRAEHDLASTGATDAGTATPRIAQIAHYHRVADGRRMRVDTTVVETNIHYPTDSSLLGDWVRVLTRAMKKIAGIIGAADAKLRDRSRSGKLRVLEIARAARAKGGQNGERLARAYRRLLEATGRVVGQAKRFARRSMTASSERL